MLAAPLWIAELLISERTADKIRSKHGLEPADVIDAVVCQEGLSYVWEDDPIRGLRAIVKTALRGRLGFVVLYPASHPLGDVYHLGSAYLINQKG